MIKRANTARVLDCATSSDVVQRLAEIYRVRGRSAERMFAFVMEHADCWALATIPLRALDFQTEEESGVARIRLARSYAQQKTPFPPIIATYGERAARRRFGKAYVQDGNHRVLAATYRGDPSIAAFVPADEYDSFVSDARFRGWIE